MCLSNLDTWACVYRDLDAGACVYRDLDARACVYREVDARRVSISRFRCRSVCPIEI